MQFILIFVLAIFGSAHAAKKSHTEVVGFNNDNKQFSCNGRNVEWYYILENNTSKILKPSEKFQINNPSENESIMTVMKINGASVGTYKCLSILDNVEEYFDLDLYYPLTINHISRPKPVQENNNVTLKCKPTSKPIVEKIIWYHGDKELVPDDDYKVVHDGILLENVKAEQAGEYLCIAIQKIGTLKNIQQREIELIVEYAPRPTSNNDTILYAKIGETVKLNCEAKSEPTPSFIWLINGYETFENINIHDDTSTLEVKINSESYLQTYTCIASNIHGESKQTFILKENLDLEQSTSRTSSKSAGDILYTLTFIISTFVIYY